MYKEYIEFYKQYTALYGKKTAIFLMVGSFYELYDIQNRETGETMCNVPEIVDLLGIQLSSKKGEMEPTEEGLFAGFPDYVLHKWAGRLTSAGWTVVIVDQYKDMRGKVKERKVSRILSPSTHIENASAAETPYVLALFLDQTTAGTPLFGASLLDLTTGTTTTHTGATQGRPDVWTADELVPFISVFQPKEVLVYWRSPYPLPSETTLYRLLGILPGTPLHRRSVETLGSFRIPLARTEYLQRVYSIRSLLPPSTYLGLRTEQEELALLYLLQFVEEHYPSMLTRFHRNEPWTPDTRLLCGNHALTQLQMVSGNGNGNATPSPCVLGLFDKCITPMGKRAIRNRILRPYSDAADILARLRELQDIQSWPAATLSALERQLRFMYDLPRLHRKLLCGLITPPEIAGLFQTYHAIGVVRTLVAGTTLVEPFTEEQWTQYLAVFHHHFSEEKARTASADQTVFSSTTYPTVFATEQEISTHIATLQSLRTELCIKGHVSEDAVRVEEREREAFGFKASTITLQQLKKYQRDLPDGTRFSELKSGGWVDCPALQHINTSVQKLREQLEHHRREWMVPACQAIAEAGQAIWSFMEDWISHVDTTQCIAKVSEEQKWTCPEIDPTAEDAKADTEAYVEVEQLRHPLVETSATRVAYVKHDVALGRGHARGWLVYGMNASGKSTLMKATGIAILLAQAGCFVPAKRMRLSPYRAVYTRILNQDNLFAGLSSFAVEMSELRDILRQATARTLVLGDELCSGAESISAQALVASGIQWLSSKRASFIFATHLHDLPKWLDLTAASVEVWHLHVAYDPVSKKLVYDRTLRPGSGSTLYGLEVARAMDLPFEFIEQAVRIRHTILESTSQEQATASSWNREVVRRACEVCHCPIRSELEVHHLQERATATNHRLPDGTSVHDKRNLIVLCEACHLRVHSGSIHVGALQQTSEGPMRVISSPAASASASASASLPASHEEEQKQAEADHVTPSGKKSKWTKEEWKTMTDTVRQYPSLSLKSIRAHLDAKENIQVSESVLRTIRKEL